MTRSNKYCLMLGIVVSACLSCATVFAENARLNVSITNPFRTTATAKGYFLALMSEEEVNIDVLPTPQGGVGVADESLSVLTNAPNGYKLYISSNQEEDYDSTHPGNGLYHNGEATSDFLKPTTTAALDDNSWGYGLTDNNFSAVPLKSAPELLKATSEPSQEIDTANASTTVYYGAKVNTAMPSGVYSGEIFYTVLADASAIEEAEVNPSTTSNFAGGDNIRITTSLFAIGDVEDFTVTVGEDDCPVTTVDTDDDVISVSCALPAKPALERSYDVVVTATKYDKTYTITDGISYVYAGFPETLTTMQDITSDICASVTTPAAFNENGTLNTNVMQTTLSDTRDNSIYTVRKLADGNCWMTNNLKIVGSRTLTPEDSDVSRDWTLPASTTSGWCSADTAACIDSPRIRNTGATYGVYYNWNAATAGTGKYAGYSSGYVDSICPKGWALPSRSNFQSLYSQYGTSANLRSNPVSMTLSGRMNTAVTGQGSQGWYYSGTEYGTDGSDDVWFLTITSSTVTIKDGSKWNGQSVRCIVK